MGILNRGTLKKGDGGFPVGQGEFEIMRSGDDRDPHAYATRVKGNSMYPYLWDGDVIELRSDVEVRSNEVALVYHEDGRKWVKKIKLHLRRHMLTCEPLNPSEEPFELSLDKVRLHKIVSVRKKGMY